MKQFIEPTHYDDTKETTLGYVIYCLVMALCILTII